MTINGNLNLKTHIQLIAKKFKIYTGILSKLRLLFSSSTLLLLHDTLKHPHFTFGLPAWVGTYLAYLCKLQRL